MNGTFMRLPFLPFFFSALISCAVACSFFLSVHVIAMKTHHQAFLHGSHLRDLPETWKCLELNATVRIVGQQSSVARDEPSGEEPARTNATEDNNNVVEVDPSSLSEILEKEDVLVVFWHPSCPSCNHYVTTPVESIHDQLRKDDGPRVVTFNMYWHWLPEMFDDGERPISVPRLQLGNKSGMVGKPFSGNFYYYPSIRDWVMLNNMMPNVTGKNEADKKK